MMFFRLRRTLFHNSQLQRNRSWFKRQLIGPFRRTRLLPKIEKLEDRSLLATVTWDGGAGTFEWADSLNWSTDAQPTASDHVVIGDLSGTPTITISTNVDCLTVVSNERIQFNRERFVVQIVSAGTFNNGSPNVSLIGGFVPTLANTFKIIDNPGTGAITGTFAGLAEGATFIIGNSAFSISYVGGTGHDIVLTNLVTKFFVTTTSNSGPGSLRQAILDANSHMGSDEIDFNIPTSDPNYNAGHISWSILPTTALPTITDAVIIDGTSQPGYATRPVIEISGNLAGSAVNGFTITSAASILEGLAINQFTGAGVALSSIGATGNVIRGNYIGTDQTGGVAKPNANGVVINGHGNTIGGVSAGERNVISGNATNGVMISGASASGNSILGNYVGTNFTGTGTMGNGGQGIQIMNGASGNIVGGKVAGAGNLISGNGGLGINVRDTGTDGNVIAGNWIGLGSDGFTRLQNVIGIVVGDGADDTRVGTDGDNVGDFFERNVISGNTYEGIVIETLTTKRTVIAGNYIGTNSAGTAAVGNGNQGIAVRFGAQDTRIGTNGSNDAFNANERNVISGNLANGIVIQTPQWDASLPSGGVQTNNTHIAGNYIGLNSLGVVLGNKLSGVLVQSGATNTLIGTDANGIADAQERNIISGNATGVQISGLGTTGTQVKGNYIGTDPSGTADFGNSGDGVQINTGASSNTIGGSGAAARNVISGNNSDGVEINGAGTTGNIVAGNYIGTAASGTIDMPVSWYPFNTFTRDVVDSNLPTASNGANVSATGKVNSGLQLSTGGFVDIPHAANLANQQFTIDAWVRPDGSGPNNDSIGSKIIGKDTSLGQASAAISWRATDNRFVFTFGDYSTERIISTNAFATGTFYHVAASYNGVTFKLYVNGVLEGQLAQVKTITYDPLIPWTIGASSATFRGAGVARTWNGIIDEVAIYNHALTLAQVQDIVTAGAAGRGAVLGNSAQGVLITNAPGNFVGQPGAGNVISGNRNFGIVVTNIGSVGNVIQSNYVGLSADGMSPAGNAFSGILVNNGATLTRIGTNADGTADSAERNVIAGNAGSGIGVSGAGTNDTSIAGNFVGTNSIGDRSISNGGYFGISVSGGAQRTRIGTDGLKGVLNVVERNVISGNTIGIGVQDVGTVNTVLAGNWIGLNATGTAVLANAGSGVELKNSSSLTRVGTNADGQGDADERNVVSGNLGHGVWIRSGTHDNTVAGNYIGTDISGKLDFGNSLDGVNMSTLTAGEVGAAYNNVIGGATAVLRNLVSGNNSDGVEINGVGASGNLVLGNYIGVDVSGTIELGNSFDGVRIVAGASNNTIGGTVSAARNIISGNTSSGVRIAEAGSSSNVVLGNYIGTSASGTLPLGNGGPGVYVVGAQGNVIGGTTTGTRNVISGNVGDGIKLNQITTIQIYGNSIGLSASGDVPIGNSGNGISVGDGVIGATIGGSLPNQGNVISGNAGNGIFAGPYSSGNFIEGNFIGTNLAGNEAEGNGLSGILVNGSNTKIGGPTNVPGSGAGNVISGNLSSGIALNSADTVIQGNLIGLNRSGTASIGNVGAGIANINGASINTQIGGTTVSARNVIAGNSSEAELNLYGANHWAIQGNFIGTNITGSQRIAGSQSGIVLHNGQSGNSNLIGGNVASAGNVISGFLSGNGIEVRQGQDNVVIIGNRIGTDQTGTIAIGNATGIFVNGYSGISGVNVDNTRIGTNGDGNGDEFEGNVISGGGTGIVVSGPAPNQRLVNTVIAGNRIGMTANGSAALANSNTGIYIGANATNTTIGGDQVVERNWIGGNYDGVTLDGATSTTLQGNQFGIGTDANSALGNFVGIRLTGTAVGNSIGGSSSNLGNTIANSQSNGMRLEGTSSASNIFLNNLYYGNLGLAIDAGAFGRTLNDAPDVDGVLNYPTVTSTHIFGNDLIVEGTIPVGSTFEIYVSAPTADGVGQGRQKLASVLDNSISDENSISGQFRIRIPLGIGLTNGTPLTFLTIGSTSEFSPIVLAGEVGSFIAPQITLGATTLSLTSGNAISVDGSFYDPDSVSWDGTVDYGDGSGVQALTLNSNNTFRLEHTYVNTGSFIATVQIRDNSLIASSKSLGVTVQNEAPTVTFNEFNITTPANEGQLVTLTGRFSDTGGTHTASIQWGDGSNSLLPLGLGVRDFSATHTYLDDSNSENTTTPFDIYRVLVTIADESGANSSTPVGLLLDEIRNVLPSALSVAFSSTSITEGQSVSLSGLFADPGLGDVHKLRIQWGDGNSTLITLPVGDRDFAGIPQLTHIYVDDQNTGADEYTITVEVADDDEPQQPAVVTKTISVVNAIPSAVLASSSSTQILENGFVTLSGSFVDLGQMDDHVVSIDWGDGSTVYAFPLSTGITTFSGKSHQYLNNPIGGGSYVIEVRVSDNDSPTLYGSAIVSVQVQNVAPVLGPLVLSTNGNAILEGGKLTISGSFTDASPQDRHTVLVNWGDGNATPATVDAVTRTYTATHQYLDNNGTPILVLGPDPIAINSYLPYSISVTVDDHDGGTATATVQQDVYNVAPTVTIEPGPSNNNRNLINLVAGIDDPGTLDTFTHGGAYRWSAEAVGISGTMQLGNASTFVVNRTAYPNALWRVSLSVADDDGGVGSFLTTLLVGTNGDDVGVNCLMVSNTMFSQAGTFNLMAMGLDGNDTIDASGVTDPKFSVTLVGGRGVDNLFGGAGDDVYLLAQGNDNANVPNSDVLNPVEAGSDRYVLRPNSVLTVVDRLGANILDFGLADFGITFDLSLVSATTLVPQDVAPLPMVAPLHIVQTQGSFSRLDGSAFGDRLTGASGATIFGDAGNDFFTAKAGTIGASFHGGDDNDILSISAVGISNLDFSGDAGADTLLNLGEITGLTFNGGADADILQNDGTILAALNFGGDAGADSLLNSGVIASLMFNGGADNDIFVNNGVTNTILDFHGDADILLTGLGSIGALTFGGDSGADIFVNLGAISSLTFNGGADNDIFVNSGSTLSTLDFGGDHDLLLSDLGSIGTLTFNGDAGIDTLINRGTVGTLTFEGGADADILQNMGTVLGGLTFGGDAGVDTLINLGSVGDLTFNGGADADILQNFGTVIGNLTFGGDLGADILTNTGSLGSLTFNGGADSDILQNNGTVIGVLVFGGDAGVDTLLNQGSIGNLSFTGGADADVLRNLSGGNIVSLNFNGDFGADLLVNLGSIIHLTFDGGADADILQNVGTILDLSFAGDAGADLLVNSGSVTLLTFNGGADNDILVNTGNVLGQLEFGGDTGLDTLVNDGIIRGLTFNGGADADFLQNTGTILTTLLFNGDTGVDTLINGGVVLDLTFNGGADSDILLNTGTVLDLLTFTGDLGADLLTNLGTVGNLTFNGGADADVLKNTGTILIHLVFNGDLGADLLLNSGPVGDLTFNGGADNDLLQNNGSGIASLNFIGGTDNDVLINNGNNISLLTFDGGAGNDVLVSNGTLIGILDFTGDTGVPVLGLTSNDTLIVRGSGSGAPNSRIRFNGGYGVDAFENNASGFASIVFNGGLDADTLLNNASGLASLDFNGDAGADVFVNHGDAIVSLAFTGGADADTLINDGIALGHLTFDGGADSDLLINSGNLLETLTFNGGADADILLNQGGQIGEIKFDGGADADVLINNGPVIDSLEFNGDAGNDRLWNRKGGIQIGSIVFTGDAGIDTLINDAAGIDVITFNGGADADVLQNNGSVLELTFNGGADADILVNAGFAGTLTFDGGADADILLNRGTQVDVLDFIGDAGIDTLFNLGPVTSLTFEGGADADILQNNAIVDSLSFFGDVNLANRPSSLHDGADTLVNNGPVRSIVFRGAADNDIFQNNAPVVELTFDGGADADTLVNNGGGITTLDFNGDAGADTLINNGSGIATIHFDGGADADALRIEGREIGNVTFNGGLGSDSFTYNGVGAAASTVHFNGEAGNDFFAMRGIATTVTFDGGNGDDGVLITGSGAMTLTGGDGDDFYRFVANPLADVTLSDSYSGVADVSKDSLDFSSFTAGPVTLDLRLVNVWQSQGTGQLRIRLLDSLAIENIIGTPLADTIYGNARNNYIGGADFDEAFSGPVAAPRGVTQWVFLDFDSKSNSGVIDTLTGLPDTGEHVYTLTERALIRQRMESIYRGPNPDTPWFDVRFVNSTSEIPATFILSNQFVTIYFNQTPSTGRPGGLASEVDPGNVNLGGTAAVQINGLLGGVINNVDSKETIEGDFDPFKRDVVEVNDTEVGASKPPATSDNFVKLSSKVAAHELAHLLGLRHQDSFGPIGSGVHDIPGGSSYKPNYTGPSGAVETFDHVIGSPASIGSTRFNDLKDLFFGEREAIKLAFANSNPSQTTANNVGGNNALAQAAPLSMVTLAVPNTVINGQNATKNLYVQISSVLGQIEVDSGTNGTHRSKSDWYSFTGRAGELINIDVLSNSVGRFGTGQNGAMTSDDFIDTIVRVYGANGQLVKYYDGLAENDDVFEPTDSSLIDLLLPADGTYYIEVDSFHRYGDPLGNPTNPLSPLNPANPNNILAYPEIVDRFLDSINDTDTGRYQLVMYKFRKSSSSDMTDTLKGFGGTDIIDGGPGDSFALAYDLGTTPTVNEGIAFARSILLDDRGATNWIGSTVDYGDGTGIQTLYVSPTGEFSLNHVWADNGSYFVSVKIVNDIGQTLSHRLNVLANNVAPVVAIVGAPITSPEGTLISLTSTVTDPGSVDTFTYVWTVTASNGQTITNGTYSTFNFTPRDNGTYVVTFAATDDDAGVSQTNSKTIAVSNVAPTVSLSFSGPSTVSTGTSITVSSTTSDPGGANDPLSFSWVITRNGGSFATQASGATYTFTPTLAGTYLVSLTVNDGDGGTSTATSTITANAAPTLAITTPIDGVFGVSSSFTFNATDTDAVDQGLTFIYVIQWGDGTTQTISGPRLRSVSHTYPTVSATGAFSISATATDARGATSIVAKADFVVLGWTLIADPLRPNEAMLVIVGSEGSDTIKVKTKDDDYYKVSIRDRDDDIRRRGTVYGDVKRILVFAHGGNDRVTIDDDVEFTVEVWGGAGDDEIKGGSGNDILMGEAGNDNLWGGNGRDIVIGGTGADRIHGDANDDLLIAGFTALENEFNQWAPSAFAASTRLTLNQQRAALEFIIAEWASSRSYAERCNNIRGTGTGTRLNGNNFFKLSDTLMTNNTVFDDSSVDQLWGDNGSDWFFANLNNDLGSVLDQIKDRSGSESQEDIDRWW